MDFIDLYWMHITITIMILWAWCERAALLGEWYYIIKFGKRTAPWCNRRADLLEPLLEWQRLNDFKAVRKTVHEINCLRAYATLHIAKEKSY